MASQQVQFLTINDFRAGIVTSTTEGASQDTLDLPPGSASDRTWGCFALPTGALAPLPALRSDLTQAFSLPGGRFDASTKKPVGLFTVGPLYNAASGQNANFADELHVMVEGELITGSFRGLTWFIRRLFFPTVVADTITNMNGTVISPNATNFKGVTGLIARVRHSLFDQPGIPTFVMEWSETPDEPTIPTFSSYGMWPDPTNPTSSTPKIIAAGPYQLMQLSGRILFLEEVHYPHGHLSDEYWTNEDIIYTDPPNSDVISTNQPTVLDADNPAGYMSWGSLVYGELFLAKKSGGAVVIDGDIYAPSVTILRGVQSSGNLMNVASPSITGLVYCVDNDGAYIWEGGNTSRKISTMGNRFYDRPSGNPNWGVAVKHSRWGQFIAFPNGWIWDTINEAWFRLVSFNSPLDPSNLALVESGKGNPDYLYCAPDTVPLSGNFNVIIFDRNSQTSTYTWWSQAIKISDNTRVDITEVVLSITNIPAAGTTIQVFLETGVNNLADPPTGTPAATFNVAAVDNNIGVIRQRLPAGIQNCLSIRCVVIVENVNVSDPAPTILSLAFGYIPSNLFPQA